MAKVLVGCEFSGVVRDAFSALGHEAYSCDLLDSETPGNHIKGDILEILNDGFDIAIMHPPCTDLAVSGSRWFPEKRADGRQKASIDFFMAIANAPIPKMAIENPIGIMSTIWRKPDQIVQPWEFGHSEAKATCLWLKNLPKLVPTNIITPRDGNPKRGWDNQTASGQNKYGPSPDRWKKRAITYRGLAEAMAMQWGGDIRGLPQAELNQELEDIKKHAGLKRNIR